ncbi:hypothetical protein B0I35DRAFT_410241 [Stachybotrys elegans]|uniref:Uncharacterized protein n=1 Tax=Stachybotrys elegans TaxID=80388 RepID=A0A8K0SUD8_9HYPO|nr:hypothetical protein B0I35DRAFT_410241 [Stachybotrys elegans]
MHISKLLPLCLSQAALAVPSLATVDSWPSLDGALDAAVFEPRNITVVPAGVLEAQMLRGGELANGIQKLDGSIDKRGYQYGGCFDFPAGTTSADKSTYWNGFLGLYDVLNSGQVGNLDQMRILSAGRIYAFDYGEARLTIRNQGRLGNARGHLEHQVPE